MQSASVFTEAVVTVLVALVAQHEPETFAFDLEEPSHIALAEVGANARPETNIASAIIRYIITHS